MIDRLLETCYARKDLISNWLYCMRDGVGPTAAPATQDATTDDQVASSQPVADTVPQVSASEAVQPSPVSAASPSSHDENVADEDFAHAPSPQTDSDAASSDIGTPPSGPDGVPAMSDALAMSLAPYYISCHRGPVSGFLGLIPSKARYSRCGHLLTVSSRQWDGTPHTCPKRPDVG